MTIPYETNQTYFLGKLEKLRTTPKQIELQKEAASKATKSNLITLLLALTLASIFISLFLKANLLVFLLTGALALYLYMLSKRFTFESLVIAKEQDRRYVMSCFREAQNIDEMNWAGWFQSFPEMEVKTEFNKKLSDEIAVKEINRMRKVFAQKNNFEDRLTEHEDSSF